MVLESENLQKILPKLKLETFEGKRAWGVDYEMCQYFEVYKLFMIGRTDSWFHK